MKIIIAGALALLLVGCGSINPQTIANAIAGHATFPSLSMAVQECVADTPEVRAQIVEPFNILVDKWAAASELEPNADMLIALAGAKTEIAEAKTAWVTIKTVIVSAGLDCGPAVASQVANIEQTFTEIESAIQSSERAVYALEWAQLLSTVVLGSRGKVVRM